MSKVGQEFKAGVSNGRRAGGIIPRCILASKPEDSKRDLKTQGRIFAPVVIAGRHFSFLAAHLRRPGGDPITETGPAIAITAPGIVS